MSIPNPHFIGPANAADLRLKKHAVIASLCVGTVLVAIKFYAYMATNAVSMLSSLLDSGFDVLASIVAFAGVVQAAAPADADHRYGHGKAEALAAFLQSLFIAVSAVFLLVEAVKRLQDPSPISSVETGIGVTVVAIILTAILVAFQRRVIARTQSMAVNADNLHYRGDLYMNIGVIAALALGAYTNFGAADGLFAGGVALYLAYGGWKIGGQAVDVLMDRELPDDTRHAILALIERHPATVSVHDLRTRAAGDRIFIEFHLEMAANLTLEQAHTVTEEIEGLIFDAYPASEVLIHPEPEGIEDQRRDDHLR